MGVAYRHLGRRQRQADAAVVGWQIIGIDRYRGRAFGQAIALDQRRLGELLPALGHGALHGGTTAYGQAQCAEVELGKVRVVEQAVEHGVDGCKRHAAVFRHHFDKAVNVARIGHQHIGAAHAQQTQAGAQREDVVHRNGGNADGLFAGVHERRAPHLHLLDVGQHIAVREHGALGHAGGAARVLQQGQVVRIQRHRSHLGAGTLGQHLAKADAVWQRVVGHQFLQAVDHKVGHRALERWHHVRQPGDHHVAHSGLGHHLRHRVGKQV